MNQTNVDLNLDELIEAVSAELRRMGLTTLPDRRASLLPDVRMVRYYTSLGLLKAPRIVQRQARYGQAHVEDLLLIKLLQSAGHSLAQIQQELIGLGPAQRAAWLAELRERAAGRTAPVPTPSQWREYVLEPGLRLQIREDYACKDLDALLRQVRSLLDPVSPSLDGSQNHD